MDGKIKSEQTQRSVFLFVCFFISCLLFSTVSIADNRSVTQSEQKQLRQENMQLARNGHHHHGHYRGHRGYHNRHYRHHRGGWGIYVGPGFYGSGYYGPRYWTGWRSYYYRGSRCSKRCLIDRRTHRIIRCKRRCYY